MNWNEQRRARHQLLVVEIPGVNARRGAVELAHRCRRCDPHAPEERMERNLDAVGEMPDHSRGIQTNDSRLAGGEIFRKKSPRGAEAVAAVRNGKIDALDADLENVAGV